MFKSIEFSFVFLSCLQVLKVYTSKCDSGSNGSECCFGFTWNHSLGKCISCSIGYIGSDCKLPCRYPSYGHLCQSACDCAVTYCDHIYGCKNHENENSTTPLYVYTEALQLRTTESPGIMSSTKNYQENLSTERYNLKTDSLTTRIGNYRYSQSQHPENDISTNTIGSTERILETTTVKFTKETGEQINCQSVKREHTKKRSGLLFLVITLSVLSVFLMMFYLYLRTIQGGHQNLETI
uniref:Uncharacterized protein LOC111110827 isoform X1 n=1 Tax=Crassostrea virginica TaxID=6565 RepID=A0A8B8BIH4_CRAVI|nr:uncharacterized protein LOC111110827 isoform X1 [Crassostrea virginica]